MSEVTVQPGPGHSISIQRTPVYQIKIERVGIPGPANSLSIGTVVEGGTASATITGQSPNQTLNLVLPAAEDGQAATIEVGTVTTLAAGEPATVTNVGDDRDAVFNFGIPGGADGVSFVWKGAYSGATAYDENDVVEDGGSSWIALQSTTGNAPPSLPTTSNAYWEIMTKAGADGLGAGTVTSVAMSVPTGFAVSGSPITTSGTFAVTYDTGYQGFTTTLKDKLDAIEASADVTDATNVASAGAAMLAVANTFTDVQTIDVVAGNGGGLLVLHHNDAAANVPSVNVRKGRVGPAPLQASDGIGTFLFSGYHNGSGYANTAAVYATALENFTTTGRGTSFEFQTVATGATTRLARMTIGAGIYHPSATGGDKGNNTINFGAVYDDNTLLSCYPFDAYLDGEIDFAKWDAKVPDRHIPASYEYVEFDTGEKDKNGRAIIGERRELIEEARVEPRQHEDMRKFAARLGTEYDPLDIDKYEAHWRAKRHLSSLPNEVSFDPVNGMPAGAWIQRLIETVEIQAIHIAELNGRLKKLEGK